MTQSNIELTLSEQDISNLIRNATEFKLNGTTCSSTISKALDRIQLLMSMSDPTHQDTINCLLDVEDILKSFK